MQCSSALLPVEGGRRSEEQGSRSLLTSQRFFSSPFPQTRVIRTHSATVLTRRRRRHPLFGPRNICVDNLSRRLARRGRSSSSQGLKVDAYRRFSHTGRIRGPPLFSRPTLISHKEVARRDHRRIFNRPDTAPIDRTILLHSL